jgi:hypothetical protein
MRATVQSLITGEGLDPRCGMVRAARVVLQFASIRRLLCLPHQPANSRQQLGSLNNSIYTGNLEVSRA